MTGEIIGFRYFMVGKMPVRMSLNEDGHMDGAFVPDRDAGKIILDMRYFPMVMDGGGVTEITAEDFEAACESYYERKAGAR